MAKKKALKKGKKLEAKKNLTVTLAMRKAGGDPGATGGAF
jgi:hypothetical protein